MSVASPPRRLFALRAWADLKTAAEFGVNIPADAASCDFGRVMARMRSLRARLSRNDSAHRFQSIGVDVFLGEAKFTGPETIQVGESTLRFVKAAICTGARAAAPDIPGLDDAGCLTNETVFNLTELPPRLAVIGAGPLGCELAQCFARFGSRVTVFERGARILAREDADAAQVVQDQMRKDGVAFVFGAKLTHVNHRAGERLIQYESAGGAAELAVDQILAGVGRAPNVQGLGLESVGVDYGVKTGVEVNSRLQTTNPRIFAAGDVCSAYKFTHVADAQAQILIQNALFPHPLGLGYASAESLIIPWCTYTDPELAHVGMYEKDAEDKGFLVDTITVKLEEVDLAILDGQEQGFARVLLKKGTGKILGATIVAAHAGDLLSEITVLLNAGKGMRTIAGTIHPYPTQAEVVKKLATAWRKKSFTEGKQKLLNALFAWLRMMPALPTRSVNEGPVGDLRGFGWRSPR